MYKTYTYLLLATMALVSPTMYAASPGSKKTLELLCQVEKSSKTIAAAIADLGGAVRQLWRGADDAKEKISHAYDAQLRQMIQEEEMRNYGSMLPRRVRDLYFEPTASLYAPWRKTPEEKRITLYNSLASAGYGVVVSVAAGSFMVSTPASFATILATGALVGAGFGYRHATRESSAMKIYRSLADYRLLAANALRLLEHIKHNDVTDPIVRKRIDRLLCSSAYIPDAYAEKEVFKPLWQRIGENMPDDSFKRAALFRHRAYEDALAEQERDAWKEGI